MLAGLGTFLSLLPALQTADASDSAAVSGPLAVADQEPRANSQQPSSPAPIPALVSVAAETQFEWDLETAVARAYELRSEVRQSSASVAQAEASVSIARAGYVPSVSLTAGYQRVRGGGLRGGGAAGVNDFSLGVTARWTATELAWVPLEVRAAEELVESAGSVEELTRRAIRLAVIVAYDTLWATKRVAILTRETLAAAQTHREYAVARQEVGIGAQADIARADVEIADATLAMAAADAAVETARAQLVRAIGLPLGTRVDIPDDEPLRGEIPPLPA
jgi:outer membrane protein TolC